MNRRNGACVDGCMSDCCYCRNVVEHYVFAVEAVIHQPLESVFPETVVIAVEIVPAHLVDNYAYNQFRTFLTVGGESGNCKQ